MLFEEIYDFYTNELSIKNLITKYMMKTWIVFNISFVAILIISALLFYFKYNFIAVIATCSYIVPILIINNKYKKILKNQHGLIIKSFMWSRDGQYIDYRINKLKEFLISKNLLEANIINNLSIHVQKKAEENKFKGWYFWGIFSILFLPLLSEIYSWFFRSITDVNHAIAIFFLLSLAIFIISFIINMLREIIIEVAERKRTIILSLNNDLEEIFFEINNTSVNDFNT